MRKKRACGRCLPARKDRVWQVRVRRERPTAPAWAIALAITMLMVYLATILPGKDMRAESAFATPRVTREMSFEAVEAYLVSLCSGASGEEARLLASGYTGMGAAGYIYEHEENWHVIGAAYDRERDAARVAGQITAEEKLDTQVICLSAPKVDLRVTAPEMQIDAIVEGDALLRTQAEQLGDMARQLERGETGPSVVCTLCAVASTRAGACADILEKIPDAGESGLCKALAGQLDTLSRLLDLIAGSGDMDTEAVSGMLRCAQINALAGQAALQRELAEQ